MADLVGYIESQIYKKIKYEPTDEQKKVVFCLSDFVINGAEHSSVIINGYAGTGKTTIISALVQVLKEAQIKTVMLAPTGRAAKVMAQYSGEITYTIHKKIYRKQSTVDANARYVLDFNKTNDTIYIVDEASMLSDQSNDTGFGSGSLLDDLFDFVNSGQRNRLIFVGDSAQLPPVGFDFSPALDPATMRRYCDPIYLTMKEVVRQAADSGVLKNATNIRLDIEAGAPRIPKLTIGRDVIKVPGAELIEMLEESFSKWGKEQTIIVTRSNKRANRYNQGIRQAILGLEEEVEPGDMLMVVKNNYTEVDKESPFEFVANGDVVIVEKIYKTVERYGFRFANMRLRMPDYDDYTMERWVLLDTLHSEAPHLTRAQQEALFEAVESDYADITVRRKRVKAVLENELFSALQVKFSYAVTCHKSQGGQWQDVYIDTLLFGDEPMTLEFSRWLYTALTRARNNVYFVGWNNDFFANLPKED